MESIRLLTVEQALSFLPALQLDDGRVDLTRRARPLVVHLPNAQMALACIKGVLNTVFIALLVRVGAVWGCLVLCGALARCSHRTYLVLT